MQSMTPADFRAWRKRLGLTQAQAAESLGRSAAWVRKAEAGAIPIHTVVALACRMIEMDRQ